MTNSEDHRVHLDEFRRSHRKTLDNHESWVLRERQWSNWTKRAVFSLITGVLFGLLIPSWGTLPTFFLSVGGLSGLILLGLVIRDGRVTHQHLDQWTDRVSEDARILDRIR